MKKNKILSSLIALSIAFSLAGCGSTVQQTGAQGNTAKTEQTAPASTQQSSTASSTNDVVATAANNYFANMPEDIYKIPEKDFITKVKANEAMTILDIRQPDVYAKGHIKGAINIPFGTAISDNLEKIPADKPVMVYCYTGQTAGQTVALLNMAGFNAKSVNLGWNLGISKVEGVADVTETTENALPANVTTAKIDPALKDAISKYFAGLADVKGTTYANYKISEDDAKKLLDTKDQSVMFLSIRSAKDYAEGHIEGALNIPFAKGMQESFNTLPKDKKIIVYCYTGQTAGQTVAGLRLLGYDAVSLNAGMGTKATAPNGWLNKGFSVVK